LFLAPKSIRSGLRDKQLERVQFVLDNSADHELVYDGDIKFNLYRPDLHYFWFSVAKNRGLDTYNAITNNKYGDYDICQLVRSQQPRFISNYELDITACGLRALYDETEYDGLYMLRELEGMEHLLWRDFGGVAGLVGYSIEEVGARGEYRLEISLWWQVLAKTDRDYTVFIHLVGTEGRVWAQEDKLLQNDSRATSAWRVGEIVREEYELPLPADIPPGEYRVVAGVYYWETGQRLPVWDENGERVADDAILLGPAILAD
jgi:hypothetical protein